MIKLNYLFLEGLYRYVKERKEDLPEWELVEEAILWDDLEYSLELMNFDPLHMGKYTFSI